MYLKILCWIACAEPENRTSVALRCPPFVNRINQCQPTTSAQAIQHNIFRYISDVDRPKFYPTCITSDNTPGSCVKLKRCKKPYDLVNINKLARTPQKEEFYRKNNCGWSNNEPMICCADVRTSSVDVNKKFDQVPPKTKPADCGISLIDRNRLFGGRPEELGSWPWMVALGYRKLSYPTINYRCGASLIADEWLLTAAHCVVETSPFQLTTARLGDLDLDDSVVDNASPVDVPIESTSVFPHPKYLDDRRNFDIALLRLKNPVQFTNLTTPICLYSGSTYEKDEFYKKKSSYVIGWGPTENGTEPTELRVVPVNIQDLKKCSDKYSKIGGKTFTDNLLCAREPGEDSCQGNSGGPLIFVNTTEVRFYLGGVVSAGKGCATDYPGLYTKVAKFISWINNVTRLDF
ncbi:hypothetical protein V9T40_003213 [Parthenolecanium corni]|uniref:CLIP domain-containing serine protease n=1 Tax=Parthenolecanium corni TaxID=536013 RepID=A0AAN9Y9G9_9HEMI